MSRRTTTPHNSGSSGPASLRLHPNTVKTLRNLSRTKKNAGNSIARSKSEINGSFNTLSLFNNKVSVAQGLMFPTNITSNKNRQNASELMGILKSEIKGGQEERTKKKANIESELYRVRGYGPQSQENLISRLAELKGGIENIVIPSPTKKKVVVYKNNNVNNDFEQFLKNNPSIFTESPTQNSKSPNINLNQLSMKLNKINLNTNRNNINLTRKSGVQVSKASQNFRNTRKKNINLTEHFNTMSSILRSAAANIPKSSSNKETFEETLNLLEKAKKIKKSVKSSNFIMTSEVKESFDRLFDKLDKFSDELQQKYLILQKRIQSQKR
jgi:hypothetical protein